MLPVTDNLSLIPSATDPHPANSTTMPSTLVCKEPKTKQKKVENAQKKDISNTFPYQKSPALSVLVVKGGDKYYYTLL